MLILKNDICKSVGGVCVCVCVCVCLCLRGRVEVSFRVLPLFFFLGGGGVYFRMKVIKLGKYFPPIFYFILPF